MNNIKPMEVSHSRNNLFEIATCLFFINFSVLNNVVKELSILNVLHDKKQVPTRLNNLVKLDNGRMSYEL